MIKAEVRRDIRFSPELALRIENFDPSILALTPKKGNRVSYNHKVNAILEDWFAKNISQ